jgi:glycosyltransferase involved in cell wall biosynthesis
MKTLLMLSYYFPPAAAVGTLRSLRFARHLPDFGWRTAVVTVEERSYDVCDASLNRQLGQDCSVYRTRLLHDGRVQHVYQETRYGGLRERGVRDSHTLTQLVAALTAIPDTRKGWLPFAVAQGLAVLRRQRVDAILTTSYPYTAHISGCILKALTGVRWVADFRDPWSEYAFLYPSTRFHRRVASILEAKVVHRADAIIANTPAARDRMRSRYPDQSQRIVVIPNGYDAEDFAEAANASPPDRYRRFILTHAGTVFPGPDRRSPLPLLQALACLFVSRPELRRVIGLRFIGHIHHKAGLEEAAASMKLENSVVAMGYLSHQRMIEQLLASHVLLLIHHSGEPIPELITTIPAKTYEYLAARRPILCLTSGGAVEGLIADTAAGMCVDPRDVASICRAISDLYDRYSDWSASARSSEISQYEARELTRRLAVLLEGQSTVGEL